MSRVPPVGVARAATGVRIAIQGLARRMAPPEIGVLELSAAFMASQVVYAVARLGIADALAAGARTAEEVAGELGTDPDATFRLLRAGEPYGIVRHAGDRFDLSAVGRTLVSRSPDSMRSVILMIGDPRYQAVWNELPSAVATGEPQAQAVHGVSMWDLVERDPAFGSVFNEAMGRLTALDWPTVAAVYDFTPFGSIVDVGGGHGQLLALMLDAAPAADGVLLEQPSLIGPAEKHLGEAGVLDRCRLVGGSFFETAPDDGDLLRPAPGHPRLRRRPGDRAAHQPAPPHAVRRDAPPARERRSDRVRAALREVPRPRHAALCRRTRADRGGVRVAALGQRLPSHSGRSHHLDDLARRSPTGGLTWTPSRRSAPPSPR